jgi:hypothetical protein
MVRFQENNIFNSNPNSINEPEFIETDSCKSNDNVQTLHRKTRELGSKEIGDLIKDDMQRLNKSEELIENITRELMKAKIAIDCCTYDESRHRFHYSIVPMFSGN